MNDEKFVVPSATFTERPDEYELKVQVPGVAKEDAELHIDGRTLSLKTHAKYQDPAGFRRVATEFERANYALSADLPEMANTASLAASLENGVLTVTVKKRSAAKAQRIEIS